MIAGGLTCLGRKRSLPMGDHIGLALTRHFEDQFVLVPFDIKFQIGVEEGPIEAGQSAEAIWGPGILGAGECGKEEQEGEKGFHQFFWGKVPSRAEGTYSNPELIRPLSACRQEIRLVSVRVWS